MLPHKDYIGQEYERSCHDKSLREFLCLSTGKESIKNQEIKQEVANLYRVKDAKGEWLYYGMNLYGKNWKANPIDFFHVEGIRIENSFGGLCNKLKNLCVDTFNICNI